MRIGTSTPSITTANSKLTDLSNELDLDTEMLDLLSLVLDDERSRNVVICREQEERLDFVLLVFAQHLLQLVLVRQRQFQVQRRAAEAQPVLTNTVHSQCERQQDAE